MYRYINGEYAYDIFNVIAYYAMMISSLFLFKLKRKPLGVLSKYAIHFASRLNQNSTKFVEILFVSAESLIFAYLLDVAVKVNHPFGRLVGTGANYFGLLIAVPILWSLLSIILVSNPLKQIDAVTLLIPIQLFFLKIACFCQGCCWGIPWEHGLYNSHINHPGKQVPVQAIEAFYAAFILLFLLIYRKKAKPGTIYPMLLTLYCSTRFFSEFLTAAYPDVLGPFNMYQILCAVGLFIGIALLILMNKYGEKISDFFEKPHIKLKEKFSHYEEEQVFVFADAKAQAEADEIERLKKVKLARKKAKVRRRK